MLSGNWSERKSRYDFVVVGSGYGGAILASRISGALKIPARTVCILERGKEWPVGSFPDTLSEVSAALRNPLINGLGLYEYLDFSDISVIKGSGLGGTSLINANVAIVPDPEVFNQTAWPRSLNLDALRPYYDQAAQMLAARPHPRALALLKVQALQRRAREIGNEAFGLNIAVNFDLQGRNPHGVEQKPCIDCGDCVTGCNVSAKNTLYMNYLPSARNNGTDIFCQAQVDWLEKLPAGGWKIHGRRYSFPAFPEKFTLEAGNVILSAGAIGSPEILLRSELHGLSISPRVGSAFSGNGDFFGLAYNSDYRTNVLGFGDNPDSKWRPNAPGPTIVAGIRYDPSLPYEKRITVEDLSFPKAYVGAVMVASGAMGGIDTDAGDEREELARRLRDNPASPYREDNALNHTMVYLVMGHDDAQGTMYMRKNFLDPNGTLEIDWDDVGRQPVFTRINEELYRHARALGAHFIAAPLWNLLNLRRLVTAHPLGGCPVGEDYQQGAVDEFGRVFAGDGSTHQGLFVADGSLIPSALGVNPFLTISAISERIADRLIRNEKGDAYPLPRARAAAEPAFDPLEAVKYREAELERIFPWAETKGVETLVNTGQRSFNMDKGIVRNDTVWKGFFPRGHILNQLSTAFYTGFKKKFTRTDKGIVGVTSDYDGRINVRNTVEEIVVKERSGTLLPGRYILLRYTDLPWSAFYDVFKAVGEDLLIGRVYLGRFPNGKRLFTFPMTRVYGMNSLTVDDHQALYQVGAAPSKEQLAGLWEMRAVANARDTGVVACLDFDLKPDGRLEARYRFLGLLEGMVEPVFARDHFQMNDFTPFHDEIRVVDKDFLVGKYTTPSPPGLSKIFGPGSLGLFQQETQPGAAPQFAFYYTLRRRKSGELPPPAFLEPLLDIRLPDGVGMTFEEEMTGWYVPGLSIPAGREGDLQLEAGPSAGGPEKSVECGFRVRMTIRDLNEFIEGSEHEARLEGTIHFGDFAGKGPATFQVDPQKSYFNYLRVNPATGEAEMVYHVYFCCLGDKEFLLEGRKYMQKNPRGSLTGLREILHDYTTLYCHVSELSSGKELGCGLLKFKTFEDPQAVGSMAKFFASFEVVGTENPIVKAEGQARFLAFTNAFILREYDPLTPAGSLPPE